MSGAHAGMIGATYLLLPSYQVTLGAGGGGADVVGWVYGSFGSISPTTPSTAIIPGYVAELASSATYDFKLLIEGAALPQDIFVSVTPAPTATIYASAAATYSTGITYSQWIWGTGSSRPWTAGMAGSQRQVTFVF